MSRNGRDTLLYLSACAAGLTLLVAGFSLSDLEIYKPFTPDALIPGAASQDIVSICVALGVLWTSMKICQGQNHAWLIWLGFMGYLTYAYALYSFEELYNTLYLAYLCIFSLSLFSIITFFHLTGIMWLPVATERAPRKRTAALFLSLVLLFSILWLSQIVSALRVGIPPEGNTILVMDLSFVLPLLAIEAVLLLRRHSLGDVLAVPLLIKASTVGLSVFVATLIAPLFGQTLVLSEVATYAILGLLPIPLIPSYLNALTARP